MHPLVHLASGSKWKLTSLQLQQLSLWLQTFPEFLMLFYLKGCCTAFLQRDFLNSSKSNCLALICPSRSSSALKNSVSRFFWGMRRIQQNERLKQQFATNMVKSMHSLSHRQMALLYWNICMAKGGYLLLVWMKKNPDVEYKFNGIARV